MRVGVEEEHWKTEPQECSQKRRHPKATRGHILEMVAGPQKQTAQRPRRVRTEKHELRFQW